MYWTSQCLLGPVISRVDFVLKEYQHTISCSSYYSPPTEVIWEKDGQRIDFNDPSFVNFHSAQIVVDRATSAYKNVLSISSPLEDVIPYSREYKYPYFYSNL